MRLVLLLLLPGLAMADTRIDLAPMPELLLLEPAFHLDRRTDRGRRSKRGVLANVAVGYDGGPTGEATVAAGLRTRRRIASASSELVMGSPDLVRGRHQAYVKLTTDNRHDLDGVATLGASFEHGRARALAPVAIGPGRRNHLAAFADEVLAVDNNKDIIEGILFRVDGSVTQWLGSPLLDSGYRGAVSAGLAVAPWDELELPRGRMELLVARMEQGRTLRKLAAAGNDSLAEVTTRTLDFMAGFNEFTGWIDHELLFAVTARFGGKGIEATSGGRTKEDTMFAMQLGARFDFGTSKLGLSISRDPTTSPDGQHILSETRLELVVGGDGRHYVFDARGGISWIVPQQGAGDVDTFKRYATALDGFVKVVAGIEVGGYYTAAYEPTVAGDPWASPLTWSVEAGVLARWRPRTY